MGSFQTVLLATALGWGVLGAVPSGGYGPPISNAPTNTITAGRSHDVTIFAPVTEFTQSSLILPSYRNVSRITLFPSPVRESSESSLDTPTFAPVTEHTQDSFQLPGGTTSYSTAYAPTIEHTQDSLEAPTGSTSRPTLSPIPIVRTERPGSSLDVPTRSTTSATQTPQPKAHLESPAIWVYVPNYGSGTAEASAAVKTTALELVPGGITVPATAHLEISRTALDRPTALPQGQDQPQGQPVGSAYVGTYRVGTITVAAGSSATVIGATTYSVATSGHAVYVNGVYSPISTPSSDSGIAAVIMGVLDAAVAGTASASSFAETQGLATQGRAAATTGSTLSRSASTASGSLTATPAVQTTNMAAGLVLPGLGLGAVTLVAAFL